MEKVIYDIGNAKYKVNRLELFRMMEEARGNLVGGAPETSHDNGSAPDPDTLKGRDDDAALSDSFMDVMRLYNEYARSESLDVLIKLKCLLEEVSTRYKSMALAEEVLTINSCLPYDRRVPCPEPGENLDH